VTIQGIHSWQDERRAHATATARAYATATTRAYAAATATVIKEKQFATATAVAPAAQATATAMVQADADRVAILNEQFGMNFVPVPGGTFRMGSPDGVGDDDEQPQHQVTVDDFWIGQTEVTNAQFRPFIEDGGYEDERWWTDAGWTWRNENNITAPSFWNDETRNGDNQPVVGVSWYEAVAYAHWLSNETGLAVRLPTEAEWERAARGDDGRIYPWGDQEPHAQLLNYSGSDIDHTTAVGSYPDGASPYGALDMTGNVYEWTHSLYMEYPYVDDDGRTARRRVELCGLLHTRRLSRQRRPR